MRDVAREAGVSLGTVSRVINDNRTVQAETRQRVEEAMRRLGYVPNAIARSMRKQTTMAVGCMVSDVSNPLFAKAVGAAEQVFHAGGYTMVLTNSRDSVDREVEILTLFQRRRLDGVICTVSREEDPTVLDLLVRCSVPVVLLERSVDLPCDSVTTDHFLGTRKAVAYLLALGHRQIGLITVTRDALPGRERAQGFEQAFADAGLAPDPALTAYHGFSEEYGYRSAYEFLTSESPPTAIVAGANQMIGVLKAVRSLELEIPRDLSLVSLGDTDLAELHGPPLTVVRWDNVRTGQLAAEILMTRLDGTARRAAVHMKLPAELVLRGSCAPPPP